VKEEFVSESGLRKPGTPRRFPAANSAASFRDKAEGLLCAVLKANFGLGAKAFRVSSSLSCRALIAYPTSVRCFTDNERPYLSVCSLVVGRDIARSILDFI